MTTPNTSPDTSLAASTSQHDSEGPFDGVPPQGTADLGFDLVGSAPLALPQAGASSLKPPMPDAKDASGSKRKQEDRDDDASDAEARTCDRKKKPKQDSSDEGASLLITPRHMSDVAGVESLVNGLQRSGSPSLDGLAYPKTDSSRSTPTLPDASSLPAVTVDLPISPPRSQTAPPTSPIITNVTKPSNPEPLHTYSCPICFSSPTNATLTPCGHIMCGECLFTAVGAAAARMGIAALAARCPVCRAPIPRWDGRGGGVIGLQPRVVITI